MTTSENEETVLKDNTKYDEAITNFAIGWTRLLANRTEGGMPVAKLQVGRWLISLGTKFGVSREDVESILKEEEIRSAAKAAQGA